jgi:hypothetical protein
MFFRFSLTRLPELRGVAPIFEGNLEGPAFSLFSRDFWLPPISSKVLVLRLGLSLIQNSGIGSISFRLNFPQISARLYRSPRSCSLGRPPSPAPEGSWTLLPRRLSLVPNAGVACPTTPRCSTSRFLSACTGIPASPLKNCLGNCESAGEPSRIRLSL